MSAARDSDDSARDRRSVPLYHSFVAFTKNIMYAALPVQQSLLVLLSKIIVVEVSREFRFEIFFSFRPAKVEVFRTHHFPSLQHPATVPEK